MVVKVSLPGVKSEDVEIIVTGDTSTIKGETKVKEEVKRDDYLYQGHRYGAFCRSISLPASLNTEKAEANFENGLLTLTIPRAEEAKPKMIKVKTKETAGGEKK